MREAITISCQLLNSMIKLGRRGRRGGCPEWKKKSGAAQWPWGPKQWPWRAIWWQAGPVPAAPGRGTWWEGAQRCRPQQALGPGWPCLQLQVGAWLGHCCSMGCHQEAGKAATNLRTSFCIKSVTLKSFNGMPSQQALGAGRPCLQLQVGAGSACCCTFALRGILKKSIKRTLILLQTIGPCRHSSICSHMSDWSDACQAQAVHCKGFAELYQPGAA